MKVDLNDIKQARERISNVVRKTPLEHSLPASRLFGTDVFYKCENLQLTGSFKIRGALNKISSLTDNERERGVIAASAGNHAQGVALSSSRLGVKSTVVMPRTSSIVKQTATRNYGAHVVLHGDIYDEAYQKAREIEQLTKATFIHPYEDELIIAGQGTVGLEIADELGDVDSVICPIGGGGLISGVAVALKTLRPRIKIYGVVSELAPAMHSLFYSAGVVPGTSVHPPLGGMSIADGISVKNPSHQMYENFIKKYVDEVVAISDEEIAEAMAFILERSKLVVEGSGAITLAAGHKLRDRLGSKCVMTMSGGNIDLNLVGEILDRGLTRAGRISRISVVATDRPGTLYRLTKMISDKGANILDVEHDRMHPSLLIRETMISFVLETRDFEHVNEIRDAFIQSGVRVRS